MCAQRRLRSACVSAQSDLSLLCTLWVGKDPRLRNADNEDSYQTEQMSMLIRDWNALPDSLISSAEDAEDYVAKFTSLVRARD